MKKYIHVLILFVCICSLAFAQTAKIVTEHVTSHQVEASEVTTNSVSTGLDIVPNGTYVYLSAKNVGNSDPITNAVFTITSQPDGSTDTLEVINSTWVQFKPTVKGEYVIQLTITTANGSDDTTKTIYASDFIGVGKFEGVNGTFPKCMSCHSGTFGSIFDKWKVSGHANIFNQQIETSTHYSTECMKCHTTGYDHNLASSNGGFDDVAASLGWSYVAPSNSGKWDTLKAQYPGLVNLATIGCESCHGPGSQHASNGGDPAMIQISLENGACFSCHDEPWRHNKVSEFENSGHIESVWEKTSAGSSAMTNSLNDCIRCHDGQGYVNFTKGQTTDSRNWVEGLNDTRITCATCHDPHGSGLESSLRPTPAGSDTLGNGYHYTVGGKGQTCMNCHKARRNNATYVLTAVSNSHWGPHGSTQSDVLLGQNAASFGSPFLTGDHKDALQDACVTCHMVATVDTSDHANRDKVGGHTFRLKNPDTGYEHVATCNSGCHGTVTSFDDFVASSDYDFDGSIEPVQQEIDGLLRQVRIQLPPVGIDSIDYTQITTLDQKKAFWNYQLILNDGSRGMHNTAFAVDVLTKSYVALGGVTPVELSSFSANVNQNAAVLSWTTATETNNKGFEVERKTGSVWQKIGFVAGKGTSTEINKYSYSDNLSGLTGKISYRLKQVDFNGTYQYTKEINVDFAGTPKEYSLSQNYPNPFNPSTVIKYSLPYDSKVKVVIYNIAGEVVKVLENNIQTAGIHSTEFSSKTGLSSGIYFYSLEATSVDGTNSFRETKKMILMK